MDQPRRPRLSCFVIGPIGDEYAEVNSVERQKYEEALEVLENVIRPACDEFGLSVIRADQIVEPGEIPEQVYRLLRDAHVVVADLTGANPNVMYELGLRHTTGKLTLQIAEKGKLPFDVSIIRTLLFMRTPTGLIEARRRLASQLAAGLERGGNPVTATRIWFEQQLPDQPLVSAPEDRQTDIASPEDTAVDNLDSALDGVIASSTALAAVIQEMNHLVSDTTPAMKSARNPSARRRVTDSLSARLSEPVSRFEVIVGDYTRSLERLSPSVTAALELAALEASSPPAQAFRERIRELVSVTEQMYPSLDGYRRAMLRAGEGTGDLQRTTVRLAASLNSVLATQPLVQSWKEHL